MEVKNTFFIEDVPHFYEPFVFLGQRPGASVEASAMLDSSIEEIEKEESSELSEITSQEVDTSHEVDTSMLDSSALEELMEAEVCVNP